MCYYGSATYQLKYDTRGTNLLEAINNAVFFKKAAFLYKKYTILLLMC